MRVSLISDAPYCFDIRLQRTAHALSDLGHAVTIFDQGFHVEQSAKCLNEGESLRSMPIPQAGAKKMLWHVMNRINPMGAYQKRSAWMVEAVLESEPDIIHCVNPMLIEAALIAAEKSGTKLIYEAYEYWPEYLFMQGGRIPSELAHYLLAAEKDASAGVDAFITVSEPLREWYEEAQGFKNGTVIYNANVSGRSLEAVEEPSSPLKVVFSGNLFQSRNVAYLLEAARLVKHPFKLFIVGDGPEKSFLLEHANSVKDFVAEVTFIDAIPPSELLKFLAQMDLGAHLDTPNNRQSDGAVPNKYFDYMRAGLGIISSSSAGAKSLHNYESFMHLLPESNKENLAAALDELSENPERVFELKRAALEAGREYSSEAAIAQIRGLYESLINA